MNDVLENNTWESAGISGDRTQNLLWRIRFGNYNISHPENIVIAIGINNLLSGNDTAEEVAARIIAVSKEAWNQFPDSRIILIGLLPAGKENKSPIRLQYDKIHHILATTKIKGVEYINPTSWFTEADGSIKSGRLYQATSQPYQYNPQNNTQYQISRKVSPMFILHQQEHIISKRRKSSETSAKSSDQKHIHIRRNQMGFFSHTEEDPYHKTTDNIDSKSPPGKRRNRNVVSQFSY